MHFLKYVLASGTVVLAGCHSSAPATSAAPSQSGAAEKVAAAPRLPTGVTAEMVEAGRSIFNNQSCAKCHGANGVGSPRAPNLTDQEWIHISGAYEEIVSLVTTGFTKGEQRDPKYPFQMNPRGGVNLSDAQIRQVAAYVWSLSHH